MNADEDGLGCLWSVVVLIGIGVASWYYWPDAWTWNNLWYSIQYGVRIDQVTIDKKPHDCDWNTAPLGSKNCHYEEKATKIIAGIGAKTGKLIVSFDDGKTWQLDDPSNPSKSHVTIRWQKVEE
jgi:hypothetical protein